MQAEHERIAILLAGPLDAANLVRAFRASREPFNTDLSQLVNEYALLGFWYAAAKRKKRTASGTDKAEWQYVEDVLEAAVKATTAGVIAIQHTNNHTERFTAR